MSDAAKLLRELDLPADVIARLPADHLEMAPEDLANHVVELTRPELLEKLPLELRDQAGILLLGAVAFVGLVKLAAEACEAIPRGHRRKALLQAYRLRHQWRKADIAKLREIGLTPVAKSRVKRLAGIEGRRAAGRGVVQPYRPLATHCQNIFHLLGVLIDPETSKRRRLAVLRQTPLWPLAVERLYRGEYAALKNVGAPSPSESAEQRVAAALNLSTAIVRKLGTSVRRLESYNTERYGGIRLVDFDYWCASGDYRVFFEGLEWDREECRRLARDATRAVDLPSDTVTERFA